MNTQIIRELIDELNKYQEVYNNGRPLISDREWDKKYARLQKLEFEEKCFYPDSPTQGVNDFNSEHNLEKVTHSHLMLSLDKTKDIHVLTDFCDVHPVCFMAKMDGLTCSLEYNNGKLVKAETRGNGTVGENILPNVLASSFVPKKINYTSTLVIDGEIICKYSDFKPYAEEFKHPRNFAAGSIRLQDPQECKNRPLTFVAWDVIVGYAEYSLLSDKLNRIKELGFNIVPYQMTSTIKNRHEIGLYEGFLETIRDMCKDYPIDGAVAKYNDLTLRDSLGMTSHHFKNALAYKFYDEEHESILRNIEWSMGRTGVLTPVGVFDPVVIKGTTISKASLANLDVMEQLLGTPYVGQKVSVVKSNEIIPQITEGEIQENPENALVPPEICPYCGSPTQITGGGMSRTLVCTNENCCCRFLNKIIYFCGSRGLDIAGLSDKTLATIFDEGLIKTYKDLFNLRDYRDKLIKIPGFGEKSVDNILNSIDEVRKNVSLDKFISALCIPQIGPNYAKTIAAEFKTYGEFRKKVDEDFNFTCLRGIGITKSMALKAYNYTDADEAAALITFGKPVTVIPTDDSDEEDILFKVVISGSLNKFKNRKEFTRFVERHGGIVQESVNKEITYVVCNDPASATDKIKRAKSYRIPILSEEDFLKKFAN